LRSNVAPYFGISDFDIRISGLSGLGVYCAHRDPHTILRRDEDWGLSKTQMQMF